LTLSSDFERTLRRLKPHKRQIRLTPRKESDLPFLGSDSGKNRSFLYDTTVYIDVLQGRFPALYEPVLRGTTAWHSTVAESELAAGCALLDPTDARTAGITKQVTEVIARMPPYRTVCPDREIWGVAGVLTGTVARLQGIPKSGRRQILNDALIFASARKYGHTVLTRNVVDFDILQQLDPAGRVLFYTV
jgi:predicted nucleic acid-binding protein